MSKLRANVWVGGTLYRKGSTPPADVASKVTNPKAWAEGSASAELDVRKRDDALEIPETPKAITLEEVKEPPRGGPGSSADAWRTFMVGQGFEVPEGASAKDMQHAWDDRDKG